MIFHSIFGYVITPSVRHMTIDKSQSSDRQDILMKYAIAIAFFLGYELC